MTERKVIMTDQAPGYIPWMAHAVVVNGIVFASGSVPRHPETLEIPEDFEGQCRQVFENLEHVLQASDSSLQRAAKVTVYLADMARWADMNAIYREYIDEAEPPARLAVQIAGLNNGYLIEVDAVAVTND